MPSAIQGLIECNQIVVNPRLGDEIRREFDSRVFTPMTGDGFPSGAIR
jgi:hypothetical protein